MSEDTVERIKRHFMKRLGSFKKFGVVWFGGEPLLQLDLIKSMSRFFITECDKRGLPYVAHIVTNGFLLRRFGNFGGLEPLGVQAN